MGSEAGETLQHGQASGGFTCGLVSARWTRARSHVRRPKKRRGKMMRGRPRWWTCSQRPAASGEIKPLLPWAVPAKGSQPLYNSQIFHLNQGRSRTKCRNSSFRDNKTTLPFIYAHGLNRLHTAPHVTTPHATGINKSGLLHCRKW